VEFGSVNKTLGLPGEPHRREVEAT
jgi:hypothetical protein